MPDQMFHLRLPDHIKAALRRAAETNHRTMTAEVIAALETALAAEEKRVAYPQKGPGQPPEIKEPAPDPVPLSAAGLARSLQRLDTQGRALVIAMLDHLQTMRDLKTQVTLLREGQKHGNP